MVRSGAADRLAARPAVAATAVLGGVSVAGLALFLARPRTGFADPSLESVALAARAVFVVAVVLIALLVVGRAAYVHLADAVLPSPVRFEARLRSIETAFGVAHLAALVWVVAVETLQSGDVRHVPFLGILVALLSAVGLLLAVAVHVGVLVGGASTNSE